MIILILKCSLVVCQVRSDSKGEMSDMSVKSTVRGGSLSGNNKINNKVVCYVYMSRFPL